MYRVLRSTVQGLYVCIPVFLYACVSVSLFPCLLIYLLYLFPCLSVYLFTGIHLIQKEGMGVWRRRIDTRSRTGTCPRQSLPICPSKGQSETSQLSNHCLKLFEILEYFTWTPSFRFTVVWFQHIPCRLIWHITQMELFECFSNPVNYELWPPTSTLCRPLQWLRWTQIWVTPRKRLHTQQELTPQTTARCAPGSSAVLPSFGRPDSTLGNPLTFFSL